MHNVAGIVIVVTALITSAGSFGAQTQDMSAVQIEPIPVAGSVHMLRGRGGNLAVCVGADGAFLVDDQYAPLTDKIRAAVATLDPRPLRFVLNTHWHGDHTGGNENLGKAGVLVVAHDNVRVRMQTLQFSKTFGDTTPASPPGALPVVTFTDAVTFHWNGDEIHAFHLPPAHTDGDAIVHFRRANVIHAGDIYFNGIYPFIDIDSGGTIDGVIAAAIASGQSLAAVQTAQPTAAFDAAWGGGFIKPGEFVETVYTDLSRR